MVNSRYAIWKQGVFLGILINPDNAVLKGADEILFQMYRNRRKIVKEREWSVYRCNTCVRSVYRVSSGYRRKERRKFVH